jgi:hypothetical protein
MDFFDGFIMRIFALRFDWFLLRSLFFREISQPKKRNPSFSRSSILNFFSEKFNPRSDRKEITRGICSLVSLSSQELVTIKSSAYRITQLPLILLPSTLLVEGNPSRTAFSSPFKAILHNNGEIMAPCGVPFLGKVLIPFSIIGAFSHFRMY